MPKYFLVAKDGREATSSREFSAADLRAYKNSSSCYTFIGELTNKVKNVGACRTRSGRLRDGVPTAVVVAPAPAAVKPAAAAVAGWWPFSKKVKQLPRDPRRMAQTVMYVPSPSGRVNQVMRGARKRRRR